MSSSPPSPYHHRLLHACRTTHQLTSFSSILRRKETGTDFPPPPPFPDALVVYDAFRDGDQNTFIMRISSDRLRNQITASVPHWCPIVLGGDVECPPDGRRLHSEVLQGPLGTRFRNHCKLLCGYRAARSNPGLRLSRAGVVQRGSRRTFCAGVVRESERDYTSCLHQLSVHVTTIYFLVYVLPVIERTLP